jgi:hypothetical protein
MSMNTALIELRTASDYLQQTLAELVITVFEDRPRDVELAGVEGLAESVSEVQACAAEAGACLGPIAEARQLPMMLPQIDSAIMQCTLRYWRDLRSHTAVSRLRATTRGRGREWQTWLGTLEQSALRCEQPLQRSNDSVRAAWREVGELLGLCLPPHAAMLFMSPDQPAQAHASAAANSARRSS